MFKVGQHVFISNSSFLDGAPGVIREIGLPNHWPLETLFLIEFPPGLQLAARWIRAAEIREQLDMKEKV